MDLLAVALILLLGIPLALAGWFGVLFAREAIRTALLHRSRRD